MIGVVASFSLSVCQLGEGPGLRRGEAAPLVEVAVAGVEGVWRAEDGLGETGAIEMDMGMRVLPGFFDLTSYRVSAENVVQFV